MGYQLWYDVVVSYIGPWFKYVTDRPTSPSWQERRNAVVWLANNCQSSNNREKYIEAFMKHYPVHSYGSCVNNMSKPGDLTMWIPPSFRPSSGGMLRASSG